MRRRKCCTRRGCRRLPGLHAITVAPRAPDLRGARNGGSDSRISRSTPAPTIQLSSSRSTPESLAGCRTMLALLLIALCIAQVVVLAVACLIKQWVRRLIATATRVLRVHAPRWRASLSTRRRPRMTRAHARSLWRDLNAMRRLGNEIHAESLALLTQSVRRALPRRALPRRPTTASQALPHQRPRACHPNGAESGLRRRQVRPATLRVTST
jgi:hypothetical protein